MTTVAVPVRRKRRLHALTCQASEGCENKATACCTRCLFYCEAHRHPDCCRDLKDGAW